MREGTKQGWADDANCGGMEVKRALLVGLGIGVKIGEAPEDAAAVVVVEGQQLRFAVILSDPKQRGYNGVECYPIVLDCSDGVVGDAPKVVAVRKIEADVDKVRVISSCAAVPQVELLLSKVAQILHIMVEPVAQGKGATL